MVEKKEFAIIFLKDIKANGEEIFHPMEVIEVTHNKKTNTFYDERDKIAYPHVSETKYDVDGGYGCRTTIELIKESVSPKLIEEIKYEILTYASKFTYKRNQNINKYIVAISKETGNEYLFEDADNLETFIEEKEDYDDKKTEIDETFGMTPQELENEIKKTIKGQDEAIRKIVTALWTTLKFRKLKKKNMLVIGPTGVGKTAIFEKIKEILNIPVTIFAVPGLSQAGYVGRSTDEILKQVYYDSGCDIEDAERTIVILDELDKLASHGTDGVSTTGVQNELLKIIEGCERYVKLDDDYSGEGFNIDTSKMIFIGTGAFQELYEKEKAAIGFNPVETTHKKENINTERLKKYGLKRELIGRLPILVELNSLGKKELKEIILESKESELKANIEALKSLGVDILNIDEVIDYIVEDAIKKQIGARGLVLTINNLFEEIFYKIGNNPSKYSKVIIGPNIINDNKDFRLVQKRTRTKKRSIAK